MEAPSKQDKPGGLNRKTGKKKHEIARPHLQDMCHRELSTGMESMELRDPSSHFASPRPGNEHDCGAFPLIRPLYACMYSVHLQKSVCLKIGDPSKSQCSSRK
jgi:hypothetical protein